MAFLNQLLDELQKDDAPSFVLEAVYDLVFRDGLGRNRVFHFSDPATWSDTALLRSILLILKVVPRYTQLFQDPHSIPVTHYRRQKSLAIHLDQEIAKVLRERVRRAQVPGLVDDKGAVISDPVLDAPILYLKQEARGKNFPKNKKGAVVSIKKLEERFEGKLLAKGIRLESVNVKVPEERFQYGP